MTAMSADSQGRSFRLDIGDQRGECLCKLGSCFVKDAAMKRSTKILITGGVFAGAVAVGSGVAVAGGGSADDDGTEVPITGEALDRASAVALDHTGEGRVTETEVEDEESYYEVEVTLDDGRQVDVQLDEDFNVVGSEADGPGDN